jgi:ribosomal protein S6
MRSRTTVKDTMFCYVNAEPACVAECDRVMKITDELLKHMIVRADGVEE